MNNKPPHIVIIGYVWPEDVSSAAGLRDNALIQAFQEANWRITFLSPSKENDFSTILQNKGIEIHPISANDSSFNSLIKELDPDFILFDRFVIEEQFSWRVKEECPNAIRITDTQDLHLLRRARENALKNKIEFSLDPENLFTEDAVREIASIYRSDLTLVLSSFENKLLLEKFNVPENLLFLAPFSYPKRVPQPQWDERKHFAFIGNYRHPPNYDSVFWLIKEIWPEIFRKIPEAELHLYGAYAPKEVSELHNPKNGIHFMGHAENQFDCLKKYRVNLAPLRFGAGIKGKIADGWWSGTPAVSTPIGMEGMTLNNNPNWGGLIANTPTEFISDAIELYSDKNLWGNCKNQGETILDQLFSLEKNSPALISKFLEIKQKITKLRNKNFIGQMLWHHQFKSTTYFSKWIEQKNKKV